MNTPYGYLSKYRSELMGISILLVVWFHTSVSFEAVESPILHNILHYFKEIGYGGVDIFFLLSGFGVWHSLQKNTISDYFLNRLKKILPIWWAYLIIKTVVDVLFFHTRIRIVEILGALFLTGYWQELANQGNWFVYAIMLFYLIAPVIFSLLYHTRRKTALALFMVILTAVISVSFFCDERLMAFSRLPVFIVGLYLASDPGRFAMTKSRWLACTGIGIAGILGIFVLYKCFDDYLWDYGIWWYPYIILAPAFALLICGIFYLIDRGSSHIGKVFRHLGKASLEILLASDFVYYFFGSHNIAGFSRDVSSFLWMIVSILAGLIFHFLIEQIKQKCFHMC